MCRELPLPPLVRMAQLSSKDYAPGGCLRGLPSVTGEGERGGEGQGRDRRGKERGGERQGRDRRGKERGGERQGRKRRGGKEGYLQTVLLLNLAAM